MQRKLFKLIISPRLEVINTLCFEESKIQIYSKCSFSAQLALAVICMSKWRSIDFI